MNKNNTYQLIEDYLNNRLDYEEKLQFENQLETDIELQKEVELTRLVNKAIVVNEELSIKEKLKNIRLKESKKNNIKKWIAVITTIIACLVILFLIKNTKPTALNIDKKKLSKKTLTIKQKSDISLQKKDQKTPTKSKVKNSSTKLDTIHLKSKEIERLTETIEKIEPVGLAQNKITSIKNELKTDINKEEKTNSAILNKCKLTLLETDVKILNSCNEYTSGSITVYSNTANAFSIDNGETYSNNPIFSYLSAGSYNVLFKDKFECVSNTINIYIDEFLCNFIISPNKSLFWELPVENFKNDKLLSLQIFHSKTGQLVLSKNINTELGFTWEGKNVNNQKPPVGVYTYIIKGVQSNTMQKGDITIVE